MPVGSGLGASVGSAGSKTCRTCERTPTGSGWERAPGSIRENRRIPQNFAGGRAATPLCTWLSQTITA